MPESGLAALHVAACQNHADVVQVAKRSKGRKIPWEPQVCMVFQWFCLIVLITWFLHGFPPVLVYFSFYQRRVFGVPDIFEPGTT